MSSPEEPGVFTRNHALKLPLVRAPRGVVRAARAGAGREVLIREALLELQLEPGAERFGVWLDGPAADESRPARRIVFHGEVRERGAGNVPGKCTSLSLEFPLPLDLLSVGKTAELTLTGEVHNPLLGPTLGMCHVLWVPVFGRNLLRGLILVAARRAGRPLPRVLAEEVALELALAVENEEQSRLARERKADLELAARVQALLAESADLDQILAELVETCTRTDGPAGVGAVFALIGERKTGLAVTAPSGARAEERLQIRALSGDPAWGHSVEQGPLEMFWRQAVETGQVTGAEAGALPLARHIARIVAVPIVVEGVTRGALLAGLPRGRTSLESQERLEYRALLAAQVLRQKEWRSERARTEAWRLALLERSDQPVALVDRNGFLRGWSQGARKVFLRESGLPALRWENPELRFVELFRPREWERVSGWLHTGAADAAGILNAQLKDGAEVECRKLDLSSPEFLAISVQRAGAEPGERRKEDTEAELRQTVDWMTEGVVVFDEAGGIRAANEHFYRLLGLTREDGAGLRTLEDLLGKVAPYAADPEAFARGWRALGELQEEESQEDLAMNWPVPQTIERCARAIVGESGRRLGRVEVYRETSARRLFQSRMVQTEKMVSLGQRVSAIVHELSNPLTTILGFAQRLLQREAGRPEPASRELRGLLAEAERATGILRQMLQLSGDAWGVHQPVSLNELVDRSASLLRASLSGSAIHLMVEKGASVPDVEGDFGQLQQVLLNLLQNAQQAILQSGRGGLIGVRTGSAGAGRARLEVWDDGPGIPGAIQARIFDPFFTTKPPGVGTGLGLAIVLGFVRQHGGTVNVLSPPKGGTRFVVELPVAQKPVKEPVEVSTVLRLPPPTVGGSLGSAEHRAPRVLVVEDEPTVGGLIADVLREEGMRVDVLRDGESALDRAEHEEYDLVICDLKMPGMDGQKFFQSLGKRRNSLQGHVLFVTGDVVAPRTQEFLERHRLPYVAKPFRVEELSRAVRGML